MGSGGAPYPDLHPGVLLRMLGSNPICRSVVLYDRIDSTNGAAMRAARSGTSGKALFIADEQSLGRGRMGRSWWSARGKSLLFSLLIRPKREPQGLTPLLALAAVRGLGGICGDVMVKWPNDLFIGERKVAGILAESRDGAVVLGMGLNVNETEEDFPVELRGKATSLAIETGRRQARGGILVRVLKELGGCYDLWCRSGLEPFVVELERRLLYRGEPVALESGGERITGVMTGLTRDGRLRLEVEGNVRILASGDLSLRRVTE